MKSAPSWSGHHAQGRNNRRCSSTPAHPPKRIPLPNRRRGCRWSIHSFSNWSSERPPEIPDPLMRFCTLYELNVLEAVTDEMGMTSAKQPGVKSAAPTNSARIFESFKNTPEVQPDFSISKGCLRLSSTALFCNFILVPLRLETC